MMFRKVLDASLRNVHPEGKGTLQKRIEALPTEIGVTPAMKTWAHQVRLLGNDAAHEDEPFNEAEAELLAGFAKVFFDIPILITRDA